MTHSPRDQKKLLNRIRRIRGQAEAIERLLTEQANCIAVLQQLTACRGALDGLIGEVLEDHVRHHLFDADHAPSATETDAVEELIDVIQTYLT